MNLETICSFFGWCAVISFGLMLFKSFAILISGDRFAKLHARLFKLEEEAVRRAYFHYLATFKLAFIFLNLVPYIALRILIAG